MFFRRYYGLEPLYVLEAFDSSLASLLIMKGACWMQHSRGLLYSIRLFILFTDSCWQVPCNGDGESPKGALAIANEFRT